MLSLHQHSFMPRLCKNHMRFCIVWSLFKLITIITFFALSKKPPIEIVQPENKRNFGNSYFNSLFKDIQEHHVKHSGHRGK